MHQPLHFHRSSMLRKKRTAPTATTVVNREEYSAGSAEVEKLGLLVKHARRKLPKLARAKTMYQQGEAVTELGDIDAAHIVLMVAKVDVDGDGIVGGSEFSRFLEDAADVIQNVQSSVLNTSIVAALLLTIVLPLLLASDDTLGHESEDLDGSMFADTSTAFTFDLSAESIEQGRRGLHVAERILLGLTCCCCFTGVFVAVAYYGCIASMPGRIAALTFLLETASALKNLQMLWSLCMLGLIASVPLVAAKVSGVTFIVATVASVAAIVFTQTIMMGCWRKQLQLLHEEAQAIVGDESDPDGGSAAQTG